MLIGIAFASRLRSSAPRACRRCLSFTADVRSALAPGAIKTPASRSRVIFSGIQPTGIPHLGNYLGALRNWKKLQDSAAQDDQLLFSIVGLHALTMPQNPDDLRRDRADMLAMLLAIGLDPKRCTIFHQEQVPYHTELAWIFTCMTPVGKLRRMTTWKSKLATARNASSSEEVDESQLSLGLLAYPVLQAADILLYKATHVPIGEDQVQHLELTRDIAALFNRTYKHDQRIFPLPQHIITPTKRVLSLRDPTQKMSKSAPDAASRILLTDTPDEVRAKLKRAVTDSSSSLSFSPDDRPGVSNLLGILAALTPGTSSAHEQVEAQPAEIAERLNEGGGSGAKLKEAVTDAVVEALRPIQAELKRLRTDPGYLHSLEMSGRDEARERAAITMNEVRKRVGLA